MHVDLIVPVFNEAGNLRETVERTIQTLRREAEGWEFGILLVVSGKSTDESERIATELDEEFTEVSRLVRRTDFGFGNAVKDGLAHADGDVLIPFMSDLSDDPSDISQMIAQIRAGYDVVYGSRFIDGGSANGYPKLKLLYNRAFNNTLRLLFGIPERDITNAFTAYRREVIEDIGVETLRSESFDITAELPLRAVVRGFRCTEVPVSWQSRTAGVSNLNATRMGSVYFRRMLAEFVRGNVAGLKDLLAAVTSQRLSYVGGAGLFGIGILVVLLSVTGATESIQAIRNVDPGFVVWIAVVYTFSFVFRTWRWRVLLRSSNHLASRANTFRSIMAGWFLNSLLPARAGDVLRAYALKTTDAVPFSIGLTTIAIERAIDVLILGSTMLAVATLTVGSPRLSRLAIGMLLLGGLIGLALVTVYIAGQRVSETMSVAGVQIGSAIRTAREVLAHIGRNPYAIALSVLISVPVWVSELTTVYFATRAVGLNPEIFPTIAAGTAAFVSQTIPITPAGIGTYEAGMTAVLVLYDISSPTAAAISVIDHLTRLVVVYVLGSIATVHLVFQSRPYFRVTDKTVEQGVTVEEELLEK